MTLREIIASVGDWLQEFAAVFVAPSVWMDSALGQDILSVVIYLLFIGVTVVLALDILRAISIFISALVGLAFNRKEIKWISILKEEVYFYPTLAIAYVVAFIVTFPVGWIVLKHLADAYEWLYWSTLGLTGALFCLFWYKYLNKLEKEVSERATG